MTNTNLAVVFGPNLLWAKDVAITLKAINPINTFTKFLLDHQKELFEAAEAWTQASPYLHTVPTFPFFVLELWASCLQYKGTIDLLGDEQSEGCGDDGESVQVSEQETCSSGWAGELVSQLLRLES